MYIVRSILKFKKKCQHAFEQLTKHILITPPQPIEVHIIKCETNDDDNDIDGPENALVDTQLKEPGENMTPKNLISTDEDGSDSDFPSEPPHKNAGILASKPNKKLSKTAKAPPKTKVIDVSNPTSLKPRYIKTKGLFECRICASRHKTQENYMKHIQSMHMPKPVFKCSTCSKEFGTRGFFEMHEKVCSADTSEPPQLKQRITCELCGASLKHTGSYRRHMQERHKPRRISCTLCPKMFVCKRDMEKHACTGETNNPVDKILLNVKS